MLNKTDIAPADEVEALENIIRGLNPIAALYKTVKANIDLKNIIGMNAYTSSRLVTQLQSRHSADRLHNDCDDAAHTHSHMDGHAPLAGPTHYELRGISSLLVTFPTLSASTLERVDVWIRTVLWENRLPEDPPAANSLEVLRCKGMFAEEGGRLHVLQGVRSLYEISEVENDGELEVGIPDTGKLVLIGKGLDERVRESLVRIISHERIER